MEKTTQTNVTFTEDQDSIKGRATFDGDSNFQEGQVIIRCSGDNRDFSLDLKKSELDQLEIYLQLVRKVEKEQLG